MIIKCNEKEIRFYFDEKKYVVVKELKEGFRCVLCEEEDEEEETNNIIDKVQINKMKSIDIVLYIQFAFASFISIKIAIVILIGMISFTYLFSCIAIGFVFYKITHKRVKSKLTASYMVINYMMMHKDNPLPDNFEEIKKMSRFLTIEELDISKKITEIYIQRMLATIITIVIGSILIQDPCYMLYFILIHIIAEYAIGEILLKYDKLNFVREILEKKANHIIQYFYTTKNVQEKDLKMAYELAKCWIKEVDL